MLQMFWFLQILFSCKNCDMSMLHVSLYTPPENNRMQKSARWKKSYYYYNINI